MIEVVWEFVVRDDALGQFELAFGPGGAWSMTFAQCPGFRGTTLLRGTPEERRYLAIELWDTEAHRQQVLAELQSEYSSLNADLESLVESRTEVGVFRVLAEATVRPRGRARPSRAEETRRRVWNAR